MVKQRFTDYFDSDKTPLIPRQNRNLEFPTGTVPVFHNPINGTPIFPDFQAKVETKFQDLEFGGEPTNFDYKQDECGLIVRAFGGHGGIIGKFDLTIVYRDPNPKCNPPPPPPKKEIPPNDDYSEFSDITQSQNDRDLWLVIPQYSYNYFSYPEENAWDFVEVECNLLSVEETQASPPFIITVEVNYTNSYTSLNSKMRANRFDTSNVDLTENVVEWEDIGGTISGFINENASVWTLKRKYKAYTYWRGVGDVSHYYSENAYIKASGRVPASEITYGAIHKFFSSSYQELIEDPNRPKNFRSSFYDRDIGILVTKQESRAKLVPIHEKPPDPPPPPPPMSCCPNVSENDQLLRLILKKIGSEHLPASVPTILTDRKKGTTQIQSLAEFTAYTVKQMDAICGRYPIDIEIEDADLTKEGNQKKKIQIPNIAETLAEMMGMLLVIRSESDATLNATIRTLTEAGSSKQMAFMAYEYAKANAEFLGYKGEQKERKIAFSFKPGEARLDKMLQQVEVSVKGWENEDKDDFNDHIAPLLELAAMWKIANFRKTGSQDTQNALKKILKNAGSFSDSIDAEIFKEKNKEHNSKDDKDKDSKELKDDWDKFTEEAEKGFITQPGITDKEHPYGRPLDERPKIRDISTDTSETKNK